MGFETPEEGYLAKIIIPAGTKNIGVGALVCIIVTDEQSIAAFKDFKDDGASTTLAATAPSASTPSPAASPQSPSSSPSPSVSRKITQTTLAASSEDRIYVSPLAKRLTAERGLSLLVC